MNTNIRRLAHVCIKSTDLEVTEAFFCGLLGFRKAFDFIRNGEPHGFYLEAAPNQFIEVFPAEKLEEDADRHPLAHFCLETDDIQAEHQRLSDIGGEPEDVTLGADNTHQFWITGPDNIRIEFQQYTNNSLQILGGVCEI